MLIKRPDHNHLDKKIPTVGCPACMMNTSYIKHVLDGKGSEALDKVYLEGPWNDDGSFPVEEGLKIHSGPNYQEMWETLKKNLTQSKENACWQYESSCEGSAYEYGIGHAIDEMEYIEGYHIKRPEK